MERNDAVRTRVHCATWLQVCQEGSFAIGLLSFATEETGVSKLL